MTSQCLDHHVKFNFVQVAAVVQIQGVKQLLEGDALVSRAELHAEGLEALADLLFLQLTVLVEVEFIEDVRALLHVVEVALTDHYQKHELVKVQCSVTVRVSKPEIEVDLIWPVRGVFEGEVQLLAVQLSGLVFVQSVEEVPEVVEVCLPHYFFHSCV